MVTLVIVTVGTVLGLVFAVKETGLVKAVGGIGGIGGGIEVRPAKRQRRK